MLKICIVLKDITESGGGERVCVNLAHMFDEMGYQVEIISFFALHNKPIFDIKPQIAIRWLSHLTPNSKNPLQKLFCKSIYRTYLSSKIDKIIMEMKPNVILANDGWYIPKHKVDSMQYVRLWHLNAPKKINKRKQKIFHLFDTLVVLSHKELSIWQHYHKNIKVIPNFLPTLSHQYTDYNQQKVVSVGRMDRGDQKGFMRLIDIWEKVQEKIATQTDKAIEQKLRDWQLIIVGDGAMKTEIEEKIKIKNLQDSIILKPFTKDIESIYLNASIYAMSSHFEGFGMVLAEASSYALACVAFDINAGPSDIIESGISGFLIDDHNIYAFADKLLLLMSDKKKRESMGFNAKKHVCEKFSKEAVMELWQKVFIAK